jgi:tetratricopeptide (TPR) repeat protein
MTDDNWFRNTDWDQAIEANFRRRLGRARGMRSQYLRIQASHLATTHPRVALDLLDEYFASGSHFDLAQAHADRARALLALGELEEAVSSYEAALQREREFPNLRTSASTDFACLVVNERLTPLYARALEVLDERPEEPLLPLERYRKNGARALLLLNLGQDDEAARFAAVAVEAAREAHSGLRYHPDLGLVADTNDEFGKRVAALARESPG